MAQKTQHLAIKTPADRVIEAFGGVRPLAREISRNPSAVARWRRSREDGGTGGTVPSTLQGRILELSQQRGLGLTAADLIMGARCDE